MPAGWGSHARGHRYGRTLGGTAQGGLQRARRCASVAAENMANATCGELRTFVLTRLGERKRALWPYPCIPIERDTRALVSGGVVSWMQDDLLFLWLPAVAP